MKFTLTKEEHAALSEALQALYIEKGEGFQLDVDISQSPDMIALMKNKNDILDEKKKEEQLRLALEAQNEASHIENLEEKNEYEKLLGIKEEKFKTELQAATDNNHLLRKQLEATLLDASVDSIAFTLAGKNSELIKPHIRARMVMKDKDGELKLFVTDATGNASSMTLEQLQNEFKENPLYAPIIQGRDSSGGGDNGTGGGGNADAAEAEKHFMPGTFNLTKQSELLKENPDLYNRMKEKYNSKSRAQTFRQVG